MFIYWVAADAENGEADVAGLGNIFPGIFP
jgi:hypothetical protein